MKKSFDRYYFKCTGINWHSIRGVSEESCWGSVKQPVVPVYFLAYETVRNGSASHRVFLITYLLLTVVKYVSIPSETEGINPQTIMGTHLNQMYALMKINVGWYNKLRAVICWLFSWKHTYLVIFVLWYHLQLESIIYQISHVSSCCPFCFT